MYYGPHNKVITYIKNTFYMQEKTVLDKIIQGYY